MDVKLVMFKANGKRKDIPINRPSTVIGRGENCDLRIPLEKVSRRHCEISLAGDGVKVKDLASSNGTYVNNKRINECPLKAGDRLVVDPVTFTLQINGMPGQITQPARRASDAKDVDVVAGDEVVDLEADVAISGGGGDEPVDLFAPADEEAEEVDPIAALEALASEGKKKAQE